MKGKGVWEKVEAEDKNDNESARDSGGRGVALTPMDGEERPNNDNKDNNNEEEGEGARLMTM